MSDYLSNLTARTLNRTAVIQPRLASRFEPSHTLGALGLSSPGLAWALAAELAFDDEQAAQPAPASPAPQSVGAAQSAYHKTAGGQFTRTTAAVATTSPVAAALDDNETFGRAPTPDQDRPLSPRPVEAPRPQLHHQTDDIVQPVQETPWTLARAAQQASQVAQPHGQFGQRPSVQALPASVTAARPIEPLVEALSAAAAAEKQGNAAYQKGDTSKLTQRGHETEHLNPPVRPAPVVAQPHVELASAIRPAPDVATPPQLASTSAATPTIQVTIGRIEVRATPPAMPPARKAAAAPAMSLDDYLRARNGGGR